MTDIFGMLPGDIFLFQPVTAARPHLLCCEPNSAPYRRAAGFRTSA